MAFLNRIFGKRDAAAKPVAPPPKPREPNFDDLREPAIWLMRTETATSVSKLGGLPNLPSNIEWPRQAVSDTPLHFLAQIDLTTLPRTPLDARGAGPRLPRDGMLFFFADMEEEMLWGWDDRGDEFAATRVLFVAKPGPERQPPEDIPEIGHAWGESNGGYGQGKPVFDAAPVQPYIIDTFADEPLYFHDGARESAEMLTIASIERATGKPVRVLDLKQSHDGEARNLPAAIVEHTYVGRPPRREVRMTRHQMLGAATSVQGTADSARKKGYVSLLQLDSDFGVDNGFMFCDMGMAQFWIKPEDLAAGRFDKAWGTTEGG